jgi:EF-hand domain-containing family member B
VPTIGSENTKDVLYAVGGDKEEKAEIARMYNKTHGNFAPGEQRNRDYNWQVDKTQHRFGYGEQRLLNGAAMSIHNERFEGSFPKTVIVKKTVEDQKAVTQDQLGQTKNMGQGKPPVAPEHAYGIRNVVGNDIWNAAKCIHGEPTEVHLMPDVDLGKSVKPGCRNVVRKPEDSNRVFGAPTIRTDIPFKEKRSIADYNVYLLFS